MFDYNIQPLVKLSKSKDYTTSTQGGGGLLEPLHKEQGYQG